jgi:hypothetical protein
MRQATESDCASLQEEANGYAAQVLTNIETQLKDMLRVVHNGRQSIAPEGPKRCQPKWDGQRTGPQAGGCPPERGPRQRQPPRPEARSRRTAK